MYFVSIGVQPTPCQDESGSLFDTALPDINGSNAMLLPTGDGNKPKGDGDPSAAPNASGILSFKWGSQKLINQVTMEFCMHP